MLAPQEAKKGFKNNLVVLVIDGWAFSQKKAGNPFHRDITPYYDGLWRNNRSLFLRHQHHLDPKASFFSGQPRSDHQYMIDQFALSDQFDQNSQIIKIIDWLKKLLVI